MQNEFRNLLVSILMLSAVVIGIVLFLTSFITSNGSSVPANVSSTLNGLSSTLNSSTQSISNSINSTSGTVQSLFGGGSSINILGSVAATFVVFGGIIISVFIFLTLIPYIFFELFAYFLNPNINPFAGMVSPLVAIGGAMIVIIMIFAIIRAVTKEDV